MNTSSRRLTSVLAALAASVLAGSVALADGRGQGGGQRGGGPSFSSGRGGGGSFGGSRGGSFGGAHQGGRSMGGERGGGWSGGGRSYSAPRGGGNMSSGTFRSGGSFSSGRDFNSGRNFSSDRNFGGSMRVSPSRPDFNSNGGMSGFNRPSNGVRIPDATRPGYSPGSHPRPGFSTTRPDFGVSRNFDDRSRIDRGDRPSFRTNPSFNGRVDRPSVDGRSNFTTRPDFNRPGFNRPGFDGRGGFVSRPGFSGPSFGRHRHWGGGYWNGVWWPRSFYRSGFATFWPVLPVGCATFWWGGRNYYLYDDVYYTWSPARYGYVVTDPPPAVGYSSSDSGSATVESEEDSNGSPSSVYVYPRNGQSEEQTANDRYECHKWAVDQTGYDPTTATPETQSSPSSDDDYRRALITCLDARGYSAK